MKRKAEDEVVGSLDSSGSPGSHKKSKTSPSTETIQNRFRNGLFDTSVRDAYTKEYASSAPYKHAVIHELVDDTLLRSVRDEVCNNLQYTLKETDIYKIHQSGDLANIDGLDPELVAKVPSLLALRDALYSETFRNYVSDITGCGPLSAKKTDMAVNVYSPGCFLLCHDDVIGSRRVSYILYLTDPDMPWQPEWGGALRLFPVQEKKNKDGEVAHVPLPDPVKVIPPAWNQLSFFAVQPGESFHDVEEVYHAETQEQLKKDGGRVRVAISGWFHIPQHGEDGYIEGEEEKNAQNSSLMQLRGNPAQFDVPQVQPVAISDPSSHHQGDFEAGDLEFLLRYISAPYLTPDVMEQIADQLEQDSTITLPDILSKAFIERLKAYIEDAETKPLPEKTAAIEKSTAWKVAQPPHKHRFLYQLSEDVRASRDITPLTELLDTLLPSPQFRKWLQIATRCTLTSQHVMARRFRRGGDYTLATGQTEPLSLELGLGITPTPGWGEEEGNEDEDEDEEAEEEGEDEDGDEEEEAAGPAADSTASKVAETAEAPAATAISAAAQISEAAVTSAQAVAGAAQYFAKMPASRAAARALLTAALALAEAMAKESGQADCIAIAANAASTLASFAAPEGSDAATEAAEEEPPKDKGKGKAVDTTEPISASTEETQPSKDKGKGKAVLRSRDNTPSIIQEDENVPDSLDTEQVDVGGMEVYLAPDNDENDDAAVYKSSGDQDSALFFQAASWNKLTLVMRDRGTLKFVKYVSRKARGDRWDISAKFGVADDGEGEWEGEGEEGLQLGDSDDEQGGGLNMGRSPSSGSSSE
ncbi:hypothetical protein E4U09_001245 [Claviceps aff. purpurea]|uniref:uS12 prolyl 3,4-dihydroxylase n=1 Tax=Claviceps aff. purpurea TaxID=1967640 RepID=A0A9P7QHI2_9HYPO|nr:hypothetical protein E4U09_001245 [Claviceps aff. purpurea]